MAMTMAYIADGARTQKEEWEYGPDEEDRMSYEEWVDDIIPGDKVDHPLVPVIYPL